MLSKKDSELITRVGPGTPMGEMMRQYWIPAMQSKELDADKEPRRIKLLGEKLIAFRDSSGDVGIMDHRCPHRCASLFFGRNEENGLRCVYHGWKFDTKGICTDMANVPSHQDFKHKVKAKAYKTIERNGLIWVFMGDQNKVPEMPQIEATMLEEEETRIVFSHRDCNWLQTLEGDIDTSHFDYLHKSGEPETYADDDPERFGALQPHPEFKVADTNIGTMYGGYRQADEGNLYWRVAQFMLPFWTMLPNRPIEEYIVARAWVPLDDYNTMGILVMRKNPGMFADKRTSAHQEYLPDTTDWLGRYKVIANQSNDYLIDRESQRTSTYTGIQGINSQDQAVTESMGAITDHSIEYLAPSDQMITQTRKRLLVAAKAFDKKGTLPPGATNPDLYFENRSGYFIAPENQNWLECYQEKITAIRNDAASG